MGVKVVKHGDYDLYVDYLKIFRVRKGLCLVIGKIGNVEDIGVQGYVKDKNLIVNVAPKGVDYSMLSIIIGIDLYVDCNNALVTTGTINNTFIVTIVDRSLFGIGGNKMEVKLCRDRFYRPIVLEKVEDFYCVKLVDGEAELLAFEVDRVNLVEMVKGILEAIEKEMIGD